MFPLLLDYRKPDPVAVNEILELLGLTERRHHLPDVYKRQLQRRVDILHAIGQHIQIFAVAVEAVTDGAGPVSYTHLDVYKRQLPFHPVSMNDSGSRPAMQKTVFPVRILLFHSCLLYTSGGVVSCGS